MPYGLQLILGAMGGCIHDEDPIALLDINKNIESLNISNSAAIVFHHINQYKNKT